MKCKYTSVQCLFVFGSFLECCSFEMAEQYCGENSETSGKNHTECLKIIDDLSVDLNNLSCEVNMVQSEFFDEELAKRFENSLKDLETQNDLLQAAIDRLTEEKDTIEQTLKTKNEELKEIICGLEQNVYVLQNKIDDLKRKPCERCEENQRLSNQGLHQRSSLCQSSSDRKYEKLENELRFQCKTIESLRCEKDVLQRELTEMRRNRVKTKLLQRRSSDQRPDQEDFRSELDATKEKNFEQTKIIDKLTKQLTCFQAQIEKLRSNEELYKNERKLLQFEVSNLRESQACQKGTQQSLTEQLHRTVDELFSAHKQIQECNQKMQQLEHIHREESKSFQDAYMELVKKHNELTDGYNEITQEYQKLAHINDEKNKIIAAFDEWKEHQIEIDNEMKKKTELFEKHLEQMLEDKQKLLDRLNETENDNYILKETLENSRHNRLGNQSSMISGTNRSYRDAESVNYNVSKVIENIRSASRNLSQRRLSLEEEATKLGK